MAGTGTFRKPKPQPQHLGVGSLVALTQPLFIGTPEYDAIEHGSPGERCTVNAIDFCNHHGTALWIKRQGGGLLLVSARQVIILPQA